MFRNLAGNLVLHERIRTTDAKAKELRRIVERLITRAVRLGDDLTTDIGTINESEERDRVLSRRVHAQREVAKFLPRQLSRTIDDDIVEDVDLVHKLFHEIAPRYIARVQEGKGGGYTRIVKLQRRKGDNAPISMIELVDAQLAQKPVREVETATEGDDAEADED